MNEKNLKYANISLCARLAEARRGQGVKILGLLSVYKTTSGIVNRNCYGIFPVTLLS